MSSTLKGHTIKEVSHSSNPLLLFSPILAFFYTLKEQTGWLWLTKRPMVFQQAQLLQFHKFSQCFYHTKRIRFIIWGLTFIIECFFIRNGFSLPKLLRTWIKLFQCFFSASSMAFPWYNASSSQISFLTGFTSHLLFLLIDFNFSLFSLVFFNLFCRFFEILLTHLIFIFFPLCRDIYPCWSGRIFRLIVVTNWNSRAPFLWIP